MAEPLTERQRAWLDDLPSSPGLGTRIAARAALDWIDHLESVNADLCAACEAIVAWDDDVEDLPRGKHIKRLGAAVESVRAALTKARGENTDV